MDVRRTEGEALATVICRELYYMVEQGWVSPQDAENVLKYTNGLGEKLIAEGKTGVRAGGHCHERADRPLPRIQ